MLAIIAIENSKTVNIYKSLLKQMGYECPSCTNIQIFRDLLKKSPDVVLSSSSVFDVPILDEIAKHPQTHWFVQERMSWAGAHELYKNSGCEDVLLECISESNLFESISRMKSASSSQDKTGELAYFRWYRTTALELKTQTSEKFLEHLDDNNTTENPDGASFLNSLEKRFFTSCENGFLSGTHFGAILYDILTERKTGTIQLRRSGIHWNIAFDNGIPFDLSTLDRDDYFGIASWALRRPEFENWIKPEDKIKAEYALLSEHPQSKTLYKSWITALLLEIFSWPEASFHWIQNDIPKHAEFHPAFSHENILNLIIQGILEWTPMSFILEVTQTCLPYFLKLKDNCTGPDKGLPMTAKAVAEKLKKGDTLPEMLAAFSVDYPVHQVVYLLLLMRNLELNA